MSEIYGAMAHDTEQKHRQAMEVERLRAKLDERMVQARGQFEVALVKVRAENAERLAALALAETSRDLARAQALKHRVVLAATVGFFAVALAGVLVGGVS